MPVQVITIGPENDFDFIPPKKRIKPWLSRFQKDDYVFIYCHYAPTEFFQVGSVTKTDVKIKPWPRPVIFPDEFFRLFAKEPLLQGLFRTLFDESINMSANLVKSLRNVLSNCSCFQENEESIDIFIVRLNDTTIQVVPQSNQSILI